MKLLIVIIVFLVLFVALAALSDWRRKQTRNGNVEFGDFDGTSGCGGGCGGD